MAYRYHKTSIRDALKDHDPNSPIYIIMFFRYRTHASYSSSAPQPFLDLPTYTGHELMMSTILPPSLLPKFN
jgi:hypothetical protein